MKKKLLIKSLTISVIIIFFGVSIQPAFAVNIRNINNKTEYKIEVIKEYEKIEKSVFLTERQANELESLIEKIRTNLDLSKSFEETALIFYNAVDSFNKLGILPNDISINEIKELSTGENRDLEKIKFRNERDNGLQNRLCLVAGSSTQTYSFGPIIPGSIVLLIPLLYISAFISDFIDIFNLSDKIIGKIIILLQEIFINMPARFLLYLSLLSIVCLQPASIGSFITFGVTQESFDPWGEPVHKKAEGWIRTIGLRGYKNYSGEFYGQLIKLWGILITFYSGIGGFTGLNIINEESKKVFYLGFGLNVEIDQKRP